nr:MAG TPA: hypothetical protein [Caudoviricetes sp.]
MLIPPSGNESVVVSYGIVKHKYNIHIMNIQSNT